MDSLTNSLDEITIQIDSEAAKAYKSASPDERKKIQFLISIWLKEVTSKDKSSLKQIMDDISEKAQARGLTPEILETILSEE
jgi:predicted restriction endonuclease